MKQIAWRAEFGDYRIICEVEGEPNGPTFAATVIENGTTLEQSETVALNMDGGRAWAMVLYSKYKLRIEQAIQAALDDLDGK